MFNKNSQLAARLFSTAFSLFVFCALFLTASTVRAQYSTTDFLVADFNNNRIAVYDSNLTFVRYLDSSIANVTGLDIMPNGNLLAVTDNSLVKIYDRSGSVVSTFSDAARLPSAFDIKASTSGKLYAANRNIATPIGEFDGDGTYSKSYVNTLNNYIYTGVAVLPDGVLWGGGADAPGVIDVFDIQSGNQTGTITLDGGQQAVGVMHFSRSTNTVLTTAATPPTFSAGISTPVVYERDLTGNLIRTFYSSDALSTYNGITRGPNGDVYATDFSNSKIYHWNANAVYLGAIDISNDVTSPANIVWAGNFVAPTAANVVVSGRVLNSYDRGVAGATVSITDIYGNVLARRTNMFGNYSFEKIAVGQTYTVSAKSKGMRFASQVINVSDDLTDLNFTQQNNEEVKMASRSKF